jgi:hypothetical protein
MKKQILLLFVGLLALAGFAQAQTTTTYTTLSAAVTDPAARTITVASATGITAGTTSLYIDRELMNVTRVSGTTISVARGMDTTTTSTHSSGAVVVIGPVGLGPFIKVDKAGSCTAANEPYLPQFNVRTGKMFDCTSSVWTEVGGPKGHYITATFCGDQPNNTTNYDSPVDGYSGGNALQAGLTANDLGYALTGTGCDAEDSTTEATADEVMYANNALYLLGLSCVTGNAGSNGTTVNIRSGAAAVSPDVTLTIATTLTTGSAVVSVPAKIAAGATVAIRQISTEDLSATNVWCQGRFQVMP